jgi:hypothetical protein
MEPDVVCGIPDNRDGVLHFAQPAQKPGGTNPAGKHCDLHERILSGLQK